MADPGIAQWLQSSGIAGIASYLFIKEWLSRRGKNGDDRERWKGLFAQHDKRLTAIEAHQESMNGKLDIIITSLIKK